MEVDRWVIVYQNIFVSTTYTLLEFQIENESLDPFILLTLIAKTNQAEGKGKSSSSSFVKRKLHYPDETSSQDRSDRLGVLSSQRIFNLRFSWIYSIKHEGSSCEICCKDFTKVC
jgi:hypothetical protein